MNALDIALLSIACTLFGAGIRQLWIASSKYTTISSETLQTKLDVNRLGGKIRDDQKDAQRRYHNMCMVIVASEDDRDTRFKICGLLKED